MSLFLLLFFIYSQWLTCFLSVKKRGNWSNLLTADEEDFGCASIVLALHETVAVKTDVEKWGEKGPVFPSGWVFL